MKEIEIKHLLLLLIFSTSLFVLLHSLRLYNTQVLPDYDQYSHISAISLIKNNGIKNPIFNHPTDYVFSLFENYVFLLRLIPFLTSIINIILLYLIFKKIIKKDKRQRFITLILIVLSPVFIHVHTTHNLVYLSFMFLLFGTLFVLNNRHMLSIGSLLISFAVNPSMFVVILIMLTIVYERNRNIKPILPIAGILLTTYIFITVNNYVPHSYSIYSLLTEFISDFGAKTGFGVFGLLIASIGLIVSWKNKNEQTIFYASLLALIVSSMFNKNILLFVDVYLAYYGGLALKTLIKRKWISQTLKSYVVILLFCGLIFSSGSYIKRFSEFGPSQSEITSLEWLKKNQEKEKVLSHHNYGFMITAVSGFGTYTDKTYYLYSRDKTRINKTTGVFSSRDLNKITSFFNKNQLRYVWINDKMKQGQVWEKEDEGILLILDNSKHFNKIYDSGKVEIWEYLG